MQMGMQTCGCADADGCKQKRKRTLTGRFQTCGWVCGHVDVWACGRVGMQMGVQPCGHADADGCKQKKKKHLLGCFECADGCAGVRKRITVKKRKKKEKERKKKNSLVWACGHVMDGMRALVGGHGWL